MVGTLVMDMSSAITRNFGDYEIVGGHCKDTKKKCLSSAGYLHMPVEIMENPGRKLQKSAAHGVNLWLHLEV